MIAEYRKKTNIMKTTKVRDVAMRTLLGIVVGAILGGGFVLFGAVGRAFYSSEGRFTRISEAVGQGLYNESPGRSDDAGSFPGTAGLVIIAGGALFGAIAGAAGGGARGGGRAGAIGGSVLGSLLLVGFLRMGEFAPAEQALLMLIIPAVALFGWLFGVIVGSAVAAIGLRRRKAGV